MTAEFGGVGMFDLSATCHVLKLSTALLSLKKIVLVTVRRISMAALCIFEAHPAHAVRIFRALFLLYKIPLIFFIFEEVRHAVNIA